MGGSQPRGLGDVFQGGGAGGYFIWVGYVGDEPPHGIGPGKLTEQGCQVYYRETVKVLRTWGLVLPTAGDSDGGVGVLRDEILCPEEEE